MVKHGVEYKYDITSHGWVIPNGYGLAWYGTVLHEWHGLDRMVQ